MKYEVIDHTADFGIHVFGADAKDLFANAAFALFDLITDIDALKGLDEHKVFVTGDDWPDIMVNWLRELLYLWTCKEMLVKTIDIFYLKEFELAASVRFDPYNPDRHEIRNEIKAVTYHQIQVEKGPLGWESKIIFDV
ncbi:MAG: archease [Proteobacteria bacterium]|nr:archease [Pseudomonadota bacterium]MBU4259016.1 archease [Pseudomonadota bacterium]MBU4287900.1 archease [Pseudomonadota bacterium]MBU4413506.1 archease [Pseudomonadota bacterium]MCG2757731.1 archease [Desulfobacteraceae bacterium]